jgi:hypothetical protein
MDNRAPEYRVLIDEMLADDKALRAKGIEGLSYSERAELRDMVARIERQLQAAQ